VAILAAKIGGHIRPSIRRTKKGALVDVYKKRKRTDVSLLRMRK